ncbi:MAG: YjbH domain-containing protein [Deltaproteobacteria bacterium]|nr:YjbH domain-containing protein [Deltaproteobacteria bacterium]
MRLLLIAILILAQLMVCAPAKGDDYPFDNPANWGGTGLMEIPTARILDDGVIRVGAAQALPFRWYTGGMGILPGLEFSGRLTQITNISGGLGEDYGSNKDKAFDLKYQVFPESRWFPALAVGLHDFHGTQQFEAQYLVMSRQIFPFDFTVGLGRKRLHGPVSLPMVDELGVFGGIEVALHPRLNLIAEYNPVEYENDPPAVRGVPEGADIPVNVGVRYKVFPNLALGLSFQRGDTLGLSLHFQEKLGDPVIPHRADPPPQVPVDRRPFQERDIKEMVSRIHIEIRKAGFTEVSVHTDGKDLTAEFTNPKYLFDQKAVGRVLRTLLFHAPPETKKLTAVVKRRQIPLLSVSVESEHLEKYLLGEIGEEIFQRLVEVKSVQDLPDQPVPAGAASDESSISYSLAIKPDLETYLNDPSGFFKFRVGVKPSATVGLWKGAQALARYDIPFYSNIESSNEAPPDSVRMDSWKYLDRDYSFDRLMIDQTIPLWERTFGRVSAGYFENMYAGIGGEVLSFFGDGRFALGLEADWVRKREPGAQLALMDVEFHTLLANAYYRFPPLGVTLQAQYGRFMAGDVGWKFIASREYNTGIIIGGWYSVTDTDGLSEFNRGYNDKGVFLSIPARIFQNRDSPVRYRYAMSPWTRDVAATPNHPYDLFSFLGGLVPSSFSSRMGSIRD